MCHINAVFAVNFVPNWIIFPLVKALALISLDFCILTIIDDFAARFALVDVRLRSCRLLLKKGQNLTEEQQREKKKLEKVAKVMKSVKLS